MAKNNKSTQLVRGGFYNKIKPKAISRTRSDINTWKSALRAADSVDNPKRTKLLRLFDDITMDAHILSQIRLRRGKFLSTPYLLKNDNNEESDAVSLLKTRVFLTILRHIWDTRLYSHTLLEMWLKDGKLSVDLIPRYNVVQEKGIVFLHEDDSSGIAYRECAEYGTSLLEFSEPGYGLLNECVPHVLLKRFAQACWGELCEIHGIPPRFIKTDTKDPEALDRAEKMMSDMGAAAWFIIDTTEDFQFAKGTDTNGDVYQNLISLCKEEISLSINGAVLGQDTKFGNRSKEQTSLEITSKLEDEDKIYVESLVNEIVMPALERIGFLPTGLKFEFQKEENTQNLWGMVKEILPYKNVPNDFIKDKFGIECTDKIDTAQAKLSNGFFA